jgi:hypothetical protein
MLHTQLGGDGCGGGNISGINHTLGWLHFKTEGGGKVDKGLEGSHCGLRGTLEEGIVGVRHGPDSYLPLPPGTPIASVQTGACRAGRLGIPRSPNR